MTVRRLIKLQRRRLVVFGGIKASELNKDSSWSGRGIRMRLHGILVGFSLGETCSALSAMIIHS